MPNPDRGQAEERSWTIDIVFYALLVILMVIVGMIASAALREGCAESRGI